MTDTRPEFPEMRRRFGTTTTEQPAPRVHHAAEAETLLSEVGNAVAGSPLITAMFAEAQVHATLALVEQQRIANLITFAQVGPDLAVALDDLRIGTAGDVWEALGL